jgi:hypothetical protein
MTYVEFLDHSVETLNPALEHRRLFLEGLSARSLRTMYKLAKGLPLGLNVNEVHRDDMIDAILWAEYGGGG